MPTKEFTEAYVYLLRITHSFLCVLSNFINSRYINICVINPYPNKYCTYLRQQIRWTAKTNILRLRCQENTRLKCALGESLYVTNRVNFKNLEQTPISNALKINTKLLAKLNNHPNWQLRQLDHDPQFVNRHIGLKSQSTKTRTKNNTERDKATIKEITLFWKEEQSRSPTRRKEEILQ